MLHAEECRLAALAACVRTAVLALTTILDISLPDYDTSKYITPRIALAAVSYHALEVPYIHTNHTSLARQPLQGPHAEGALEKTGGAAQAAPSPALLQGWLVWDSVFFADIAARGYVYEQYYAFFPLLPALLGLASARLFAVLALAANAFASVVGTVLLYRLGVNVTRSTRLSALACLFFILSPAAIFHAAPYTEAAFTAATLTALHWLHCRDRLAPAVAAVAASCGLRSNGVVNAGYLGHYCLRRAVAAWSHSKARALGQAFLGVAATAVAVSPLLAFQYAAYNTFCRKDGRAAAPPPPSRPLAGGWEPHVGSEGGGAAGQWPRPWCASRLPYVYGFVQAEYWNVGFLRYYTLQQLPNFLLAAPVLLLSAAGLIEYCTAHRRHVLLRLGLTPLPPPSPRTPSPPPAAAAIPHSPSAADNRAGRSSAEAYGAAGIPLMTVLRRRWLQQRRRRLEEQQPAAAGEGSPRPTHGSHHVGAGTNNAPLAGSAAGSSEAVSTSAAAGGGGSGCGAGHNDGDSGGDADEVDGGGGGGGYLNPELAVFMYPWAFSLAIALTAMHVQVATRFLTSACPALYWYAAHLWLRARRPQRGWGSCGDGRKGEGVGMGWCGAALWRWCLCYTALGCVLFINFYPWT